jgi:hypothetical protein
MFRAVFGPCLGYNNRLAILIPRVRIDLSKGMSSNFLISGKAENSSIHDELERAPIDAFKEKKVTFEDNHKVFGDDGGKLDRFVA